MSIIKMLNNNMLLGISIVLAIGFIAVTGLLIMQIHESKQLYNKLKHRIIKLGHQHSGVHNRIETEKNKVKQLETTIIAGLQDLETTDVEINKRIKDKVDRVNTRANERSARVKGRLSDLEGADVEIIRKVTSNRDRIRNVNKRAREASDRITDLEGRT